MPFQDIQRVTEAERASRAKIAQAQAQAGQMEAAARRDGEAAVAAARDAAQRQAQAQFVQAEERAGDRAARARADSERACQAMARQAERRLDQAAELIARMVTEG